MCHLPHITRSHQGHDPEVQQRQQDPQESVCQVTLFTFVSWRNSEKKVVQKYKMLNVMSSCCEGNYLITSHNCFLTLSC